MKVAIVHFWLVGMRGGEKVVEALLDIYPQADVFAHVVDYGAISPKIAGHVKGCTFIGRLPLAKRWYQSYLPFMPLALEQIDLRGYDLVISSESGPAKGVIVDPDALHVCYCHSPMRYVWDMYHDYRERAGWLKRLFMPLLMHYLRIWDVSSAQRVSVFVANSRYVRSRIRQYYNRGADVIFPPVAVDDFKIVSDKESYFLLVGELVSYKRADLAIKAFVANGRHLKVVGGGEQFKELQCLASPNVEMLGKVGFDELKQLYARAQALIFPGVEDFGMVPVEAMASGTPVIAYAKGGALDTVQDGVSGLLFREQSIESLNGAVERFESGVHEFKPERLREYARQFDKRRFTEKIADFISDKMAQK